MAFLTDPASAARTVAGRRRGHPLSIRALTAGLVASYRLTDPGSGKVVRSGLLVRRTAHTSLDAVQKGGVGVSDCSHALKAGAP